MAFFLDFPLLASSFRLSWRYAKPLAPLFIAFSLLTDAILAIGKAGMLYPALHGLAPTALAANGAANFGGLLVALVLLTFLLPVEMVLFLGMMRHLRRDTPFDLRLLGGFLLARYSAAFQGFWQGLGRLIAIMIALGIIVAVLLMGMANGMGGVLSGLLVIALIAGGIFMVLFILPFGFATYDCVLHSPMPFGEALARAKRALTGRRVEVALGFLLASLPAMAVQSLPLPTGLPSALFLLIVGSLLSIPPTVLTYLYYEGFEALSPLPGNPLAASPER